MEHFGMYTWTEITHQPQAWAEVLEAFRVREAAVRAAWEALMPQQVIFIGCGSTHYLAMSAAALFQSVVGLPSRAYPASEIIFHPWRLGRTPGRTLLVALSRSGTTTETLAAIRAFRRAGGGRVWCITCYPDSPMASRADLVLPAEAAQERSVAQTRSFASMLLWVQALAALLGGEDPLSLDQLPELGRRLIEASGERMATLGHRDDLNRFYYLGSGFRYGVASEAMLKMKEMSLTHSEAFYFLEFRHGPISMVEPGALVIGLMGRATRRHEARVLDDVLARGGEVLSLVPGGEDSAGSLVLPDLPAWAMPVLYLPPLQLLAYHRAVSRGLNPDAPRHLTAVVHLDEEALLSTL